MTKEELENLIGLKKEIEVLEMELRNMPTVTDSVKGSSPEYPYINHTIVIEGAKKGLDRQLYNKLNEKKIQRKYELNRLEDWIDRIPDSEDRTIFRLRFREGLTLDKIGEKMNYAKSTIRDRINKYLD